jgi:hypothetical protein
VFHVKRSYINVKASGMSSKVAPLVPSEIYCSSMPFLLD